MFTRVALIAAFGIAAMAQAPRGDGFGRGPGGMPPNARILGAFAGDLGRVVKGAPYSADVITENTQKLADGNRIRQTSSATVYRDSEGRVRNEQSLRGLGALAPNVNLPRIVFINDPVAGVNYALNLTDKTATKSFGRPRGSDGGRRGRGGPGFPGSEQGNLNVKTESLGKQTIEGVAAEGTRTTVTIPAGQMGNESPIYIVSEVWYSPDLQTVVLSRHSDPRVGETLFRLTNINRVEPSAALFQPPSDFKVVEGGRGGRPLPPQR